VTSLGTLTNFQPLKLMTTFTFTRFFQKSPNIKKTFVIATRVTTTTWIHYCLIQLTLSSRKLPEVTSSSHLLQKLHGGHLTKTIGDWIRKLLKAWSKQLITKLLEGANCKMICRVLGSIMSDWRFKNIDWGTSIVYYLLFQPLQQRNASQPTLLCKHFIS